MATGEDGATDTEELIERCYRIGRDGVVDDVTDAERQLLNGDGEEDGEEDEEEEDLVHGERVDHVIFAPAVDGSETEDSGAELGERRDVPASAREARGQTGKGVMGEGKERDVSTASESRDPENGGAHGEGAAGNESSGWSSNEVGADGGGAGAGKRDEQASSGWSSSLDELKARSERYLSAPDSAVSGAAGGPAPGGEMSSDWSSA